MLSIRGLVIVLICGGLLFAIVGSSFDHLKLSNVEITYFFVQVLLVTGCLLYCPIVF